MQVVKSQQHLLDVHSGKRLTEASDFLQKTFQTATIYILKYNAQKLSTLYRIDILHDVVMIQSFKQINLICDGMFQVRFSCLYRLFVIRLEPIQPDELDGHIFSGVCIDGFVYAPVSSTANNFLEFLTNLIALIKFLTYLPISFGTTICF